MSMSNFDWLSSLCRIQDHAWHDQNVIRICDIQDFQFYTSKESLYRESIDPRNIKGISYAYSYNCFSDITWKGLLNSLKRFDYVKTKFLTEEDLIEHIHTDYNEPKTVFKFGDTLITTTGQHRLALAKFLEIPSVEVNVIEHHLDFNSLAKYHQRQRQIAFLKMAGLVDSQYCVHHSNYLDRYLTIKIFGRPFSLDANFLDSLIPQYEQLKEPGLMIEMEFKRKSRWLENDCYGQINSQDQIRYYSYLLSKHKFSQH